MSSIISDNGDVINPRTLDKIFTCCLGIDNESKKEIIKTLIDENKPLTINELSEKTGLSKAYLSMLITQLDIVKIDIDHERIKGKKGRKPKIYSIDKRMLNKKIDMCMRTLEKIRKQFEDNEV